MTNYACLFLSFRTERGIPYGEERFITHTLNDKCPNAKGANGRENQLRITRYECEYIIVYAP